MKPLGPSDIGSIDKQLIERIIEKINSKLSDPQWVKDWRRGGTENPHYRFVESGTASDKDKAELTKMFRESGWGVVEVTNSEDNGERPGLVQVTLYVKSPDAPPLVIERG